MDTNKASQSFSAVASHHKPQQVTRGQSYEGASPEKLCTLSVPLIDFCTAVFPSEALENFKGDIYAFIKYVFDCNERLAIGAVSEKTWLFCPYSASITDITNTLAGKLGIRSDGSFIVSLSGQGCSHIFDWVAVAKKLELYGAHLTRVDIAIDDLYGKTFSVESFKEAWNNDEFTGNGRPPSARFIDDMGSGKGCTLYIGKKGHKELCIYEKGKQLGDSSSSHTRCELRLFSNKTELPLDTLVNPNIYFAGAYPLLAQYIVGEAQKLLVKERMVNASAKAMIAFMKNQGGTALRLVFDALGEDASEFLMKEIARDGRPGRFKSFTGDLPQYFKTQVKELYNESHC